ARRTGKLIDALKDQQHQQALNGMEIVFGLKFNGTVDAYVAQAGSEATMTVKISWNVKGVSDD
ncbi:MAG: CU044_2847 family protein, partial [Chloroflexota bacterium]